jgi:endogenous inhibitor of DNA gyrase (YacG/DUF329 family)
VVRSKENSSVVRFAFRNTENETEAERHANNAIVQELLNERVFEFDEQQHDIPRKRTSIQESKWMNEESAIPSEALKQGEVSSHLSDDYVFHPRPERQAVQVAVPNDFVENKVEDDSWMNEESAIPSEVKKKKKKKTSK